MVVKKWNNALRNGVTEAEIYNENVESWNRLVDACFGDNAGGFADVSLMYTPGGRGGTPRVHSIEGHPVPPQPIVPPNLGEA